MHESSASQIESESPVYHIAGNFGKVFNLANSAKIAKLKMCQYRSINACAPIALSIQITKFKFRQYQRSAFSPNLVFAKVSLCMVFVWLATHCVLEGSWLVTCCSRMHAHVQIRPSELQTHTYLLPVAHPLPPPPDADSCMIE